MKRQVIVLPDEEFVEYIGPPGSLSYNRDKKVVHSHDGMRKGGRSISGLGDPPPEDGQFYGVYRGRWAPIETEKKEMTSLGPGSQVLIAGDEQAGFYGEVPSGELISGEDLALAIGLSAGLPINDGEPWLKFAYREQVLFIAKRPLRYKIPWSEIRAAQLVIGERTIVINGSEFRIRLMRGGDNDPATGPGGEWDDLIYPIHVNDPLGRSWASYTDMDLTIGGTVNGSGTWCIESGIESGTWRVLRGRSNLTHFIVISQVNIGSSNGWRPVLELIR